MEYVLVLMDSVKKLEMVGGQSLSQNLTARPAFPMFFSLKYLLQVIELK
jgi:hypothetical protein